MSKDFNHLNTWMEKMSKESGLPIYKIANKAGINRATIYKWLGDKSRPEPETMLKIAQVLAPLLGRPSHDVLAEALSQYTPNTVGRPQGTKDRPGSVRVRSK